MLSDDARAPKSIFRFKQLIATTIGTFLIDINLNYQMDLDFVVALRNYRSIDIMTKFQARMMMDVKFGYAIAYIVEFGLYVKGNLLRVQWLL